MGVFYLHHRISKALDLFTTEEIDLVEYAKVLRDVVKPLQIITERSPTFVSYISAEGIRVNFVVDHLSVKGPRPRVWLQEGVSLTLDVLDNIGANKICSVVSRGEPRDAVDLFFLLKDEKELFFGSLKKPRGGRPCLRICFTLVLSSRGSPRPLRGCLPK